MRVLVVVLLFWLAAANACVRRTVDVHPQPCPTGRSLMNEVAHADIEQPRVLDRFVPPVPIPDSVRRSRSTIRVVVDTTGRVMQDSVTVCGINDARYRSKVADAVFQLRFRPARLANRPIIAPMTFVYDF
jgi:hypothetical protein